MAAVASAFHAVRGSSPAPSRARGSKVSAALPAAQASACPTSRPALGRNGRRRQRQAGGKVTGPVELPAAAGGLGGRDNAGVAIGTLYRHFPTRLDLLTATFQPRLQQFLDGANKALEMNDPWEGLVYYLEHLFGMQAGDRGFNDFLSRRFTGSAETERIHDEMCQQIVDMLTRAQEAGEARRDITLADIVNLIWSNGRIIEATSATAPNAWRRYLYLMLDAYRAERAHPIPEPPMTYEQLYDAMVHLSEAE